MICSFACRSTTETIDPSSVGSGKFQITFQNSTEVILDDSHLELYEVNNLEHILHLNSAGIAKIRSYIIWDSSYTPPFANPAALYKKNFSVKFDGKELYSGQFFSQISSATYNGFVILDVYQIMRSDSLIIAMGYPAPSYYQGTDARNNTDLFNYLRALGKFKQTN